MLSFPAVAADLPSYLGAAELNHIIQRIETKPPCIIATVLLYVKHPSVQSAGVGHPFTYCLG